VGAVSRVFLSLTGFLLIAGVVYRLSSGEPIGTTLLLVAAATFCFLGFVARALASGEESEEAATEELVHVAPTIWPLGFAIAGVVLALGLVVTEWLFLLGGVLFVLCAAGWLRDVARSRTHADGS
jgi:Co/Zn/Cd efflux system component